MDDMLLCVELDSGKELWRFAAASKTSSLGAPNTPCIHNGKVLFVGNTGILYALNAADGNELWRVDASGGKRCQPAASVMVVAGKVIVSDQATVAVNIKDGSLAWKSDAAVSHGSPTCWIHNNKPYIITAGMKLACLDAETGEKVWEVEGDKGSASPVVSGELLAMDYCYRGVIMYNLSPNGAAEAYPIEIKPAGMGHQTCSPCFDGNLLYMWDSQKSFCYDTEKRKMLWTGAGPGDGKPSPILADNKLICSNPGKVWIIDARDGSTLVTARIQSEKCTSCGLVDGRLLTNSGSHFRCYDLRKK
jgi:outer membrane protein assembly factor BamB